MEKTYSGIIHKYYLEGSTIVRESVSGNDDYEMLFMYGQNGIVGFTYNNINYYYRKNLLGDIVAIYNESGTKLCEYAYDAWGNCTILFDTNGIGALNPFRYRGYYWDSELNLYYLNTRYYDPAICRFISQDSIKYLEPEKLNGLNLFAYCLNNPVMGTDPDGTDAIYLALYEFGNDGLPVVGHAALLIEDVDGNWWYTEYSVENAFDWSSSYVRCYQLGENGFKDAQNYIVSKYPKNLWQIILACIGFCGVSYVRYEGDYTGSLAQAQSYLAKGYKDSLFNSTNYNLFLHNCLHYVKDLLKVGKSERGLMQLEGYSAQIIPKQFLHESIVVKFVSSRWGLIKKFLGLIRRISL